MTVITNPLFQDPGPLAGTALGWAVVAVVSEHRFAAFDVAQPEAYEDFEQEWLGNQNFDHEWAEVSSETAIFYAAMITATPYDDFEQGWSDNEHFLLALGPVEEALFAGDAGEGFEHDWSSNQFFKHDWSEVSSTSALFGAGLEPFDGLENGWNNDAFLPDWGGVTPDPLVLADGATAETFAAVVSVQVVPAPGGIGLPTNIDPSLAVRVMVSCSVGAVFSVQVQGKYESTWRDVGDPITAADEVEIPEGMKQARVMTVTYSGGTLSARYTWALL